MFCEFYDPIGTNRTISSYCAARPYLRGPLLEIWSFIREERSLLRDSLLYEVFTVAMAPRVFVARGGVLLSAPILLVQIGLRGSRFHTAESQQNGRA